MSAGNTTIRDAMHLRIEAERKIAEILSDLSGILGLDADGMEVNTFHGDTPRDYRVKLHIRI
jgi:hypothetical protein